jgi:hypothetical protein
MKTQRNLSGIYFRAKNEETGKWDNITFEDLSEEEQDKRLDGRDTEWVKSLAKQLANTINRIAEQFDIISD